MTTSSCRRKQKESSAIEIEHSDQSIRSRRNRPYGSKVLRDHSDFAIFQANPQKGGRLHSLRNVNRSVSSVR